MTWREAITDGRVFNEMTDVSRFRRAFTKLISTRRTWPSPQDFLDALPKMEKPREARALVDESSRERVNAMLNSFAKRMRFGTEEGDEHVA